MSNIIKDLFELQDTSYRDFQAKLIPNISKENIIGVRTPLLKKYAKEMVKSKNYSNFLEELPHQYFDEYQLHAFIISELTSYDECLSYLNKFLPFMDNWATCDQTSPKVFKKNTNDLLKYIKKWIKSKDVYTIRFGIGILMKYYLDEQFRIEYLDMVCNVSSHEFYVNMMRAWYFATALAKQYDSTIIYLENNKLDTWTHNKTIQKAIESYRITDEKKEYLRSLKRKD